MPPGHHRARCSQSTSGLLGTLGSVAFHRPHLASLGTHNCRACVCGARGSHCAALHVPDQSTHTLPRLRGEPRPGPACQSRREPEELPPRREGRAAQRGQPRVPGRKGRGRRETGQ